MKKKNIFIIMFGCVIILGITFLLMRSTRKGSVVINDINLNMVEDVIIGSELPKVLYADQNKIIFYNAGIYVYEFKNKEITHALDIISFIETQITNSEDFDIRSGQFVSEDGSHILIEYSDYSNVEKNDLPLYYSYSVDSKEIKEVSEEEFIDKKKSVFECEYLEYEQELYSKSTGMIARINNEEYVYLKINGYNLSELQIVYVNGTQETVYNAFK